MLFGDGCNEVVQQAENSAVTIQCENYLAELRRSKGRYTDQDQQSRFKIHLYDLSMLSNKIKKYFGVFFSTVGRQEPVDPGDIDLDEIMKGGFLSDFR